MARKSKYEEWFPAKAYECALAGATDEEIAAVLGVGLTTYYGYQKRYPEFRQSIKDGKILPDLQVVGALHKSAVGHTEHETKIIGSGDSEREATTSRYFPPNPTSMIFWLKNRRPHEWRDKQDLVHGVDPESASLPELIGFFGKAAARKANGAAQDMDTE